MQQDADHVLVLACQRGDPEAFARLVRAYQGAALRSAYLMTADRQGAEDVVQNTFLNVFRHLDRFDPTRPFRPWFFGILANEARLHQRRRRRLRLAPFPSHPAEDGAGDPLLDGAIRADERARIRAAFAGLAEPFRTTAILYYVNELSVGEVAAALSCRSGTVKSRLHAARQRLQAALTPPTDRADMARAARREGG